MSLEKPTGQLFGETVVASAEAFDERADGTGALSFVAYATCGTINVRIRSGRSVKKARTLSLALGPAVNRTQELTQRLTAEILSGRLRPGARLPTEQELAAATGVSRTVVREAVAALRADGLVMTRQGLGAFVPTDVQRRPFRIDPNEVKTGEDVLQILELRMGLEIEASGLAAERRTNQDLAQIEAALRSIDDQIDVGGNAVDADFRFHLAIFRGVHNRFYPQLLEFLGNFIIPRQILNIAGGGDPQRARYLRKIQTEHVAIYEAIRARNTAAARKAARRHLANSLSRYQQFSARGPRQAEAAASRKPNSRRAFPVAGCAASKVSWPAGAYLCRARRGRHRSKTPPYARVFADESPFRRGHLSVSRSRVWLC